MFGLKTNEIKASNWLLKNFNQSKGNFWCYVTLESKESHHVKALSKPGHKIDTFLVEQFVSVHFGLLKDVR